MPTTHNTHLAKILKPHLEPSLQSHGPKDTNEAPQERTELEEAMKVIQIPVVKAETATIVTDMSLERLVQGGPVSKSSSDKLNHKLFSEMQMRRKGQKEPVLQGNRPPRSRGEKKREQRARSFAGSADASVFAAMEAAVASGRIRLPNQPPLALDDHITPTNVKDVKISVVPVKLENAAFRKDEEDAFSGANLYDIPAYKGGDTDTKVTSPSSSDVFRPAVKRE